MHALTLTRSTPSKHTAEAPGNKLAQLGPWLRPLCVFALVSLVLAAVVAALPRVDTRLLWLFAPLAGGAAVRAAELLAGAALRVLRRRAAHERMLTRARRNARVPSALKLSSAASIRA